MKNLMKAYANTGMEKGRFPSRSLGTEAMLENNCLGGCCEGTVFTFTSAGSNGRSRPRVRYKASVLNAHGLAVKEEPTDSVFTEMRMMPRSIEVPPDSVELWNPASWLMSTAYVESSRADDSAEQRSHRMKKLGGQTAPDHSASTGLKEVVKEDDRKGQEVVNEEPAARKGRRYLKCDNYREKQKYVLVEDDKKWRLMKKSVDCHAGSSSAKVDPGHVLENSREASYKCSKPLEERRNKRDCCAEEIHVFEQRKVKCARRKEQDSCSNRYEGMHNDNPSKDEEELHVKSTSNRFGGRQEDVEQLKDKQAGYNADERKIQRGAKLGSTEEPKDKSWNDLSEQKEVCSFHKRGKGTSEGADCVPPPRKACLPLRSESESSTNAPLAFSFISFKEGVPCIRRRRFRIAEETSMRASTSSTEDTEDVIQRQVPSIRLSDEKRAQDFLSASKRLEMGLEISGTSNTGIERDAEIKLGTAEPETSKSKFKSIKDKGRPAISETLGIGHEVSKCAKSTHSPCEESFSASYRVTGKYFERGGDVATSLTLGGVEETGFENVLRGGIFNKQQTCEDERGYGTYGENIFHRRPKKMGEGLSALADGFSSRLLDWYGSIEVDNDLEITDIECDDERSMERESEKGSYQRLGMEEHVQGSADLRSDIHAGLLDANKTVQITDASKCEPSKVTHPFVDKMTPKSDYSPPSVRADNIIQRTGSRKLEESLAGIDTEFPDGKHSAEICNSRSGIVRPDVGALSHSPPKSLPFRRQAWSKGFKKKSGEKVSYFERWLGRDKKDSGSLRLYKKSSGSKCVLKGGELLHVDGILEVKLDDKIEKLPQSVNSIERHLRPQAWSMDENQAYVAKEFEILEAVLQSQIPLDYNESEKSDHSHCASIKASATVGIDEQKGWRQQEPGKVQRTSKPQALNRGDVNSGAQLLKTRGKSLSPEPSIRQNVCVGREQMPEREGFQQTLSEDECSTPKCSGHPVSSKEHEFLLAQSIESNNGDQTREYWPSVEDRHVPCASPPYDSSKDGSHIVSGRKTNFSSQHEQNSWARYGKCVEAGLETFRYEDVSMVQTSKERLPLNAETHGLAPVKQRGLVSEKKCCAHQTKPPSAYYKAGEGTKPCPPLFTVDNCFNFSTGDILIHKVLENRDEAVDEKDLVLRFGALAAQTSSASQLSSVHHETDQSSWVDVAVECASGSRGYNDPVHVGNPEQGQGDKSSIDSLSLGRPSHGEHPTISNIKEKDKLKDKVPSVRLPMSLGDGSAEEHTEAQMVAGICQVTGTGGSEIQKLNSVQVMLESTDNSIQHCTSCRHEQSSLPHLTDSLTELVTPVKFIDLECTANCTLESDSESHFCTPSEVTTTQEISEEDEKVKGSSANRRHKMPIIVRVRNRLANGWWLQHSLWKRVAKQKMKAGDVQVLATNGFDQNDNVEDTSNLLAGSGSIAENLKSTSQSRDEILIFANPASIQDSDLHRTKDPQTFILEVISGIDKPLENAKSQQGMDPVEQYQPRIDIITSRQSALGGYDLGEQNDLVVGRVKQEPSRDLATAEDNQLNMDISHCEQGSIVSLACWQSKAAAFEKRSEIDENVGQCLGAAMLNRECQTAVLEKVREFDGCSENLPAVCLAERESQTSKSQTSDVQIDKEHIQAALQHHAETTTSTYCQTERCAHTELLEANQDYSWIRSQVERNGSPITEETAESSELSQKSKSVHKHKSLHAQHENLDSFSSVSLDCCDELLPQQPETPGVTQIPDCAELLIHDKPSIDVEGIFTPPMDNVLDYLPLEPVLEISGSPKSFQQQSCKGIAKEVPHKIVPDFVQPSDHVRITPPFWPPQLDTALNIRKDMCVWGDAPLPQEANEDRRTPSPQRRGIKDSSSTSWSSQHNKDLEHCNLLEMMKLPSSHLPPLPGTKSKDLTVTDKREHVCSPSKQTSAWDVYYHGDCDETQGNVYWEEERTHQKSKLLSAEEQVYLERFSTCCDNFNSCKVPPRSTFFGFSNSGCECSAQPNCSSSPDFSTRKRLVSAQEGLCLARSASLSVCKTVEPTSQPAHEQLITSLHPNVSHPSSVEARGTEPSQEYHHCKRPNAYKSQILPDYAGSFGCATPCSPTNGSFDSMSERNLTRAQPCRACLNRYDHGEGRGQCADEVQGCKASSIRYHFPSLMMHNSPFPAHYQKLALNSQQLFSASHTSESTPFRYDPFNHSCRCSSCVLLNCHCPPCNTSMSHHNHCHLPELAQPVTASVAEPIMFEQTRPIYHNGCSGQYAKTNTVRPYSPLQVMQPGDRSRPWSYQQPPARWPPDILHFADSNIAAHMFQDSGLSKGNLTPGKDQEKGLVWLSQEEMNLIRHLRLSGGKLDKGLQAQLELSVDTPSSNKEQRIEEALAVCRHGAAACIQRHWRTYSEKKTEDVKLEIGKQTTTLSLPTENPMWHDDHLQYCKLHQAAVSLHFSSGSPQELRHGSVVKRWYTTMQKAASIIQRAWRSVMRSRKDKIWSAREYPKDLKSLYDIVKNRHLRTGLTAPSFELFAKSVEQIQAATEGARVRRRLKSRRLQTIIMEIKEIRMLLFEMSQEANCDSTPYLFPQLCTQLQQKILQLHTALDGQQMEARFLLKRCPATPLALYPSRSTSPKPLGSVASQRPGEQALMKLSSAPSKAKRVYTPLLTKPSSAVSAGKVEQTQPSMRLSAVPAGKKMAHTESSVLLTEGCKGKAMPLRIATPDSSDTTDPPDSAKLLPWYFLAQRSPSKCAGGQRTPIDVSTGHEAHVREDAENTDSAQIKSQPSWTIQKASPDSNDLDSSVNRSFDERPLPVPRRREMNEMSLEDTAVGVSSAGMYLMEYAPSTDLSDRPKRPFLKRKSIVMPSQKLDWSKVKPMVSSRLEPELKTKLSLCKGPTKETTKTSSRKKKANYSNVKSRLFSYEENISPGASGDGTGFLAQTTGPSEANFSQGLRNLTRGPSAQGTEHGRNARDLPEGQRESSPDLMRLKCQLEPTAEAEFALKPSQDSVLDTQSIATYSSRFNSARYLHKLGNSEQGPCQQQPQRIRLRIVPRSKENEVGRLFVQEINIQEEMQESWKSQNHNADEKGTRRPTHSHRYAIYEAATRGDIHAPSRCDGTIRPRSP